MLLTPTELERLTIYTAAELARKRRAKGLRLNHPEATAITWLTLVGRATNWAVCPANSGASTGE